MPREAAWTECSVCCVATYIEFLSHCACLSKLRWRAPPAFVAAEVGWRPPADSSFPDGWSMTPTVVFRFMRVPFCLTLRGEVRLPADMFGNPAVLGAGLSRSTRYRIHPAVRGTHTLSLMQRRTSAVARRAMRADHAAQENEKGRRRQVSRPRPGRRGNETAAPGRAADASSVCLDGLGRYPPGARQPLGPCVRNRHVALRLESLDQKPFLFDTLGSLASAGGNVKSSCARVGAMQRLRHTRVPRSKSLANLEAPDDALGEG